ncbi:5-oxoprolinase [Parasteatoda tepidariorum]|uniref:5-oxoprolinase n=1 Tax=Parasteatoda tepidariorum TaxID=114398 RepID=UPI001C71C2A1|nr:5-oxoprolinase isoform X2 [Parasteatoda tepidariorum]XP_042898774.1 5-oxoprolinase isoform X3 [Parasteatoda tepidariorum]XP_042898775.1 5-oxoprolinase isoform X2 [Parasteatoda tepidariorum]
MEDKFCFAIDRGGTFTDVFAVCPGRKVKVLKLLSDDPSNYKDAPREGIRRILSEVTGKKYEMDEPLQTDEIDWIRMGTTVATNALLERKGERIALVITSGFKDVLHIGNQSRPKIFSLEIKCPEDLYEEIIEVDERIVLEKSKCEIKKICPTLISTTGENVKVWTPLNEEKLRNDLNIVLSKGIKSLAVVLIHSYMFPDHEQYVGRIAKEMGFDHVSLSSEVMPMVKIVPRGHTACVDAYLTPCIKRYVTNFSNGFENKLENVNVLFMQSDGGLTPMNLFCGSRAILSGPAGGVVGYSKTTYSKKSPMPVIGFDMGGTSTDVSRYDGYYDHVYDTVIAGVNIQAPQLDIQTVAAGGGSRLFFRTGLLVVGPESAGAHPGPVCYRKGGPLTVTDANLCLGRLQPDYFPKIFGATEDLPLDKDGTIKAFEELSAEVSQFNDSQSAEKSKEVQSIEELALGFIKVANEAMCRPIRALTQGKGFDTSQHILACFGGAGSQHACAIAKNLGISSIFIHKYAGILSAFGMALADVVSEEQEACVEVYCPENYQYFDTKINELSTRCCENLKSQGFKEEELSFDVFLNMRYERTDCSLMCPPFPFASALSCAHGDFLKSFLERYKREFGFCIPDRPIIVDDIRVRAIGNRHLNLADTIEEAADPPQHKEIVQCYFDDGYKETKIFLLSDLLYKHEIYGPAIIIDVNCTILVEPDCLASVTKDGSILMKVLKASVQGISTELDMIQLSIFSHRFMSIAEQMGKILQRTSVSTNIKERLDFSCALFGPDGGLVSNAPHIPVHLGAMQEAVQFQMRHLGDNIHDGDVILSNHPCAGGSHLPDLTVITPVFHENVPKPVFFVACRGHHADIGGLTPGSMPPSSTSLLQEGASFVSFKLVKEGIFQEEEVTEMLKAPGLLPGCCGTRNLSDNLSDLRAQVAANRKGITLVHEIIKQYSLEVVQSYMTYIQQNAELAVRDMLKEIGETSRKSRGTTTLAASDCMDDGTVINLKIDIDVDKGSAVFDFSGTGYQVYGNCNAPRAVTLSAIIYCLRCMVGHDVPLNQGCLAPVKIVIPEGSILCPSDTAAVVGGNVLTSQRVVDVIFKAFKTCAASQGCMNNITFGDETVGYYETVAGGAGAGPDWHGRSGIHTHMTNTRITDPEILERRYPVILEKFHLNPGTGGKGKFKGGDGVIRKLVFRKDCMLSILTERRVFAPYGLEGGEDGSKGLNLLIRNDGRTINLGAKNSTTVRAGDSFLLHTPGGGGYGKQCD